MDEVDDRPSDEPGPPSRRSTVGAVLASPYSNLALFLATIVSTFFVGTSVVDSFFQTDHGHPLRGWIFAVPLLAILATHEAGHWLFARWHRVDASLPYFIPVPLALGTLGAVIAMRGRIRSRNALLDIGASGPIAGLLVAIPVLAIGLRLSPVNPIPEHGLDEGQSLFYLLMKRIVLGPIPATHDVFLHPTAFAGWAGLLMTMLNLVPVAQLDGGHIAYALFGPRQDLYSKRVRYGLLGVALVVGLVSAWSKLRIHAPWRAVFGALLQGQNWIIWFALLTVLTRLSGSKHPPTEPGELSLARRCIAWAMLVMFALLFMPVVFSDH
jgi:membrane-associated protease RseP (regulator of RpoE activity)